MVNFDTIKDRAAIRKGGEDALKALLYPTQERETLRAIPDDRILAEMARRIFYSGFVWKVIDAKWPGFEEAFSGFDPAFLNIAPDEYWHSLASDTRIIRNGAKIMAVRTNAGFLRSLAESHGSAAAFFADWPQNDQIGLIEVLTKRGSRLGGLTGQYLLRAIGRDAFITTPDVLTCLRTAGVPLSASGTTKKDLQLIQSTFNDWVEQTGLSLTNLSRISAFSVGVPAAH